MLRTFRKYQRSIFGLLAIGMVAVAMSGFGVNLARQRHESHAIKVNDRVISFSDLDQERHTIEANYRQRVGSLYNQMAEMFRKRANQEAIDSSIAKTLLVDKAQQYGFYAGDSSVKERLLMDREMFPEGFDMARYSAILRAEGMSSSQFEDRLKTQLLVNQLLGSYRDVAFASKREAELSVELDEYRYTVAYLSISPDNVKKDLPPPTDDEITSYYEDHTSDFELPARVSYQYAVLDPKNFASSVEVNPDDVELFYSDNEARFALPEEIKARHIVFSIPSGAKPEEKDAIKKKAEDIRAKLLEGGSSGAGSTDKFSEFAKQHSQDVGSALKGGDLGWLQKGKMSKPFDAAAFKLGPGDISSVVETPQGYEIIKVDEKKEARQKPIEEVRAEIEQAIRDREAPAYTASKAQDLYDLWSKSDQDLAAFAAQHTLKVEDSSGLLDAQKDPESLKGLSAKVLEQADLKKLLLDSGDKSILVSVKEIKEPEIQQKSQVKDKIVDALLNQAAKKKAKETADSLLENFPKEGLQAVAKVKGYEYKEEKDVASAKAQGVLSNPEIHSAIFSTFKPMEKPSKVFQVGEKNYLVQVTAVTEPKKEDVQGKLVTAQEKEDQFLSNLMISSLISQLKREAKIDIDPNVLARG